MKTTLRAAAAALLLSLTVGLFSSCAQRNGGSYTYMGEDLSPYLSLSLSDLSGLAVTVDKKKTVSLADTRDFLFQQTGVEDYLTTYVDQPIKEGDRLYFAYRVLYNGEDVPFLTNYHDDRGTACVVGDDKIFLAGTAGEALWKGIIDASAKPEDYLLDKRRTGEVVSGETVYVSYTATYDGTNEIYEKRSAIRLDTSVSDGDYSFLNQYVIGLEPGERVTRTQVFHDPVSNRYISYTVTVLFRLAGETPIAVDVTLPADYDKGGDLAYLGGKTVTFHIVPYRLERFQPEFLADMQELLTEMESADYEEAIYAALETRVNSYAERIVDYPEKALSAAKDEIYGYIRLGYEDYKAQVPDTKKSFSDYEKELFLQSGFLSADLAYESFAKDAVREYLVWFRAAQILGITLEEEKHQELYESYIASLIKDSSLTKKDVEELYADYYGEDYLYFFVGFTIIKTDVLEALRKTAIVTEKEPEE